MRKPLLILIEWDTFVICACSKPTEIFDNKKSGTQSQDEMNSALVGDERLELPTPSV